MARGWKGNPEGHGRAGRLGGAKVSADREHMAEIGRKGGTAVSQDHEHMAELGRRGGRKVSENKEHMATIGKKGGESRESRNKQALRGLHKKAGVACNVQLPILIVKCKINRLL